MDAALEKQYGNRLRVRASGLCWRDGALLMVNHSGLKAGDFWAPPGGGVEFGEPVSERLHKEFLEETGVEIKIGRFLFACEFIGPPFHAIELFFDVDIMGGELIKGNDPELPIISDVRFMTADELGSIPEADRHGIFQLVQSPIDLKLLTGFFTI